MHPYRDKMYPYGEGLKVSGGQVRGSGMAGMAKAIYTNDKAGMAQPYHRTHSFAV